MVHTLRLDNYSPTPRKLVLGTNSSFGTESIKIERGAGWDGLNLTQRGISPGGKSRCAWPCWMGMPWTCRQR